MQMITTQEKTTYKSELERYFKAFRNNILGVDLKFESPYGIQKMIYTDWTASGRLYRPIEEKMNTRFWSLCGPIHIRRLQSQVLP